MTDPLLSITVADFKAYFPRPFKYGTTPDAIWDSDISKALNEAYYTIRRSTIKGNLLIIAFKYLAAHLLVMNYRSDFAGVQSVGQQMIASDSQGVSESYVIPKKFKDNAVVNDYAKTDWGLKYLSLWLPNAIGNVGSVPSFPGQNIDYQQENPFGFQI